MSLGKSCFAFLRTRYPALSEITDDLEGRGLKLIRFQQPPHQGRMCGTLKFSGLPDDYILEFAIRPSEVNRLREHGILRYRLRELPLSYL